MAKKKVVHLYDYNTLKEAPDFIKREYFAKNENGAKCGYVRKNVTTDRSEVTCKLCLREMNK